VPASELRKATLPILFDVLECQQLKAGSLCEVSQRFAFNEHDTGILSSITGSTVECQFSQTVAFLKADAFVDFISASVAL